MTQDDNHENEFESVYKDKGREELVEDDEITPEEEAFMVGYDSEPEKKEEEDDDEEYNKAFEKTGKKKKKK